MTTYKRLRALAKRAVGRGRALALPWLASKKILELRSYAVWLVWYRIDRFGSNKIRGKEETSLLALASWAYCPKPRLVQPLCLHFAFQSRPNRARETETAGEPSGGGGGLTSKSKGQRSGAEERGVGAEERGTGRGQPEPGGRG